jgi:diguanylate cyclase (GGDEF)-like protein
MSPASSWSTQQLAEFVVAVSEAQDEAVALRVAVERAAEALDADAAAIVRDGELRHSIGWPAGHAPAAQLASLQGAGSVHVPSLGDIAATVAPLGADQGGQLIVARSSDGFDVVEVSLLRGMARMLGLSLRTLRVIDDERRARAESEAQARENARLLEILRERQRLLEGLASIQRLISQRAPLAEVFGAIVGLAGELLGDEVTSLFLRDAEDHDTIVIAACTGLDAELLARVRRRRVGEGVAGRAVAEQRLVVADDYANAQAAMSVFVDRRLQTAMAAPVYENGAVVGSLLVSTYQQDRHYSRADQEMLQTIAQHASIALTDSKTVNTMAHQALHDALTGLPNRLLFGDRLSHALERAERSGSEVAVLFLDLDRFKTVNDSLGHAAGDDLLCTVAERVATCMRSADTAARLGGDEFAVLLEDLTSSTEAVRVAERIVEALRAPIAVAGREIFVSTSIGIATGAGDLLRQADVAMYRAKAEGKGRFAIYEAGMQAEVLERLDIEGALQRAVERGELELHYQPIIALATGTMAGVEALLRWNHPERGLVMPLSFVPLAEETGLIVGIGRFVIREACRQAAAWRAAGAPAGLSVNVNLSGRQLEDPGLLDTVAGALRETGLDPGSLVLEITETVLMQDTEATIERLRALRALGVRLAVDDFGTGYSSLRYLNRFPVDVLKMAKPFVDGLGAGAEHSALARAIVDLGANLGMHIVAEGIERPEQLDALRALGCGYGQGYHFSRPLAAGELTPQVLGEGPRILPAASSSATVATV